MLYPVSGIYSSDTPQFWEITMDVASITVTVLKVKKLLKHCKGAFIIYLEGGL